MERRLCLVLSRDGGGLRDPSHPAEGFAPGNSALPKPGPGLPVRTWKKFRCLRTPLGRWAESQVGVGTCCRRGFRGSSASLEVVGVEVEGGQEVCLLSGFCHSQVLAARKIVGFLTQG